MAQIPGHRAGEHGGQREDLEKDQIKESQHAVCPAKVAKQKEGVYILYFPGGAVDKNLPANARDKGQSLVQEDSTRLGADKPVQHNF